MLTREAVLRMFLRRLSGLRFVCYCCWEMNGGREGIRAPVGDLQSAALSRSYPSRGSVDARELCATECLVLRSEYSSHIA